MNHLDFLIEGLWMRLARSIERETYTKEMRITLIQELTYLLCQKELVKRLSGS